MSEKVKHRKIIKRWRLNTDLASGGIIVLLLGALCDGIACILISTSSPLSPNYATTLWLLNQLSLIGLSLIILGALLTVIGLTFGEFKTVTEERET
jgi:hypothetical protein